MAKKTARRKAAKKKTSAKRTRGSAAAAKKRSASKRAQPWAALTRAEAARVTTVTFSDGECKCVLSEPTVLKIVVDTLRNELHPDLDIKPSTNFDEADIGRESRLRYWDAIRPQLGECCTTGNDVNDISVAGCATPRAIAALIWKEREWGR